MTSQAISTMNRKQIWSHIDEHQLPVEKAASTKAARAALVAYYEREMAQDDATDIALKEPAIETAGDFDAEIIDSALVAQTVSSEEQQVLPTNALASLSISVSALAKLVGNLKLSSPDTFRLSFGLKGLEVFGVSSRLTVRGIEPLADFQGICGAVILPIAFANLVAKLPKGEQVTIVIDELLNLRLTCLASIYESQGGSPENYPVPFRVSSTEAFQSAVFAVSDLRDSIRRVGYAARKPAALTAKILQMICLDLEGGQMTAIDGHRIAVAPSTDLGRTKSPSTLTLPRPIWQSIAKLPDSSSDVTITWHQGCVVATFSDSSLQLVCSWTEQKFPAVGDIISAVWKATASYCTVDAADILGKLATVSPIVDDQKTLRLSFTDTQLLIQALGMEKGEASVSVPITGTDVSGLTLAMNCEYLREAFSSFGSGSVRMDFERGKQSFPVAITRGGFAAYVMPVAIK